MVLEKTLESPLDCKEIQPVHSEGDSHSDCGDNVIIINAEKVVLTGNKMDQKYYVRYTGYPGGQRIRTIGEQLKRKPTFVLEHAIKGMLPKNKLGSAIFRNLYVYEGPNHNHEAQQPIELKINTIKNKK